MKNNLEDLAKTKIVVVCGPTATGKSGLANALCKRFGGQVVGADSMQIYKGLPIGTAAVTPKEAGGIPQHLVGFLPPEQSFSVANYITHAKAAINTIAAQGMLPVVSGGTGLYLSALTTGTVFTPQPPQPALRQQLQSQLQKLGAAAMLAQLAQVDPAHAATLNPADEKRILRGLEQWHLTGKTRLQRDEASRGEAPYNTLCIGLNYSSRQLLYAQINARVDAMLEQGLLEEAKQVYANQNQYKTAAQAIGYKEFFAYFDSTATLQACTEKLKQATRNYAKRQLTWFRAMPNIHWLMVDEEGLEEKAAALVQNFTGQ
ncbi:tRNA (adenosine(37)-N6)-dimethylallyltransferase MiaA [Ruminococcaceae bacterium OttesenSCG-928-A16]|nr:tRNA (adenosine(37)-N6)-dimethylallyltransferase MiaA [Ruminococcaceae bacterium OttesenSCG-928-A16]